MANPAEGKKRRITIELTETDCALLSVLDDEGKVEHVLLNLADHATQGVYRPGAWEREWIRSIFSDDFTDKLEPGDPYGRDNCDLIFQRPRGPNGTPTPPTLHKLNGREGV